MSWQDAAANLAAALVPSLVGGLLLIGLASVLVAALVRRHRMRRAAAAVRATETPGKGGAAPATVQPQSSLPVTGLFGRRVSGANPAEDPEAGRKADPAGVIRVQTGGLTRNDSAKSSDAGASAHASGPASHALDLVKTQTAAIVSSLPLLPAGMQ